MIRSILGKDDVKDLTSLKDEVTKANNKKGTPPLPVEVKDKDFAPEKIEKVVVEAPQKPKKVRAKKEEPPEEKDQFNAYLPVSMIDKLDAIRMEGVKRARKAPSWAVVLERLIETYEEKNGKIRVK